MPPNFHKNKEERILDVRRRFHFDPKTQQTRNHKFLPKSRPSHVVIKDDNGEFSTVKDQADFNDSSWLAKLVNGLEQSEAPNSRPASDCLFQNCDSASYASNTKHSSQSTINTTMERKNKAGNRRSLPNTSIRKEEGNEISGNTVGRSIDEKRHVNSPIVQARPKSVKETSQFAKKTTKGTGNSKKKVQANEEEGHKNSLVNYSSIKEEEDSPKHDKSPKMVKQRDEAIVIDLDEISIKTEISKDVTPAQNRRKPKGNPTKNEQPQKSDVNKATPKEQRPKQNSQDKLNRARSRRQINKENNPPENIGASAQNKLGKTSYENPKNTLAVRLDFSEQPPHKEICGKSPEFTSHNQFLDTFKLQPVSVKIPPPRVGMIKKNIISQNKKTEEPTTHIFKVAYDKHNQNVVSKRQQGAVSQSQRQDCLSQVKQSPKFTIPDLKEVTTPPKNQYFSCIFRKLNIKKEGRIHKQNLYERGLSQAQKYQFGAIISKVKYLQACFTQQQFVQECIRNTRSQQNYVTFKSETLTRHRAMSQNEERLRSCCVSDSNSQQAYNRSEMKAGRNQNERPGYNCIRRQQRHSANIDVTSFKPLFPETGQLDPVGTSLSRVSQLQSYTDRAASAGPAPKAEESDLGSKIDSLNSKLSSYIQSNNLEDTYRKFKLEFVQLRRNMQY